MIAFIDANRDEYGVEPICEVLPIAPSTYHAHKARERAPETAPARVQRDEALKPEIQRVRARSAMLRMRWTSAGSSGPKT